MTSLPWLATCASSEFEQDAGMSTTADANSSRSRLEIKPLRIGPLVIDPPILQAPMAGFTNFAFRQIVRDYGGAGLQATEMVNARGFVWMDQMKAEHPDRLWGVKTSRDRWPFRSGTTIRRCSPRSDIAWPASIKSVSSTSILAALFGKSPKRRIAARTCCAFRIAWARSSKALSPPVGQRRDGQDPAWLHARPDQCHRRRSSG